MGGFANNAPIVTDGLVFYVDAGNGLSYPGSGTTWSDLVGGNDGTFSATPTTDSANGGSIVFDGVDDYVDYNNLIPCPSTISCSVWFKRATSAVQHHLITSHGPTRQQFQFKAGANDYIVFTINDGTGFSASVGATTLSTGAWNNLAGTYDGTTVKLYLNGVLDATNSSGPSGNIDSSGSNMELLLAARDATTPKVFADGNMSCASIYNRALSGDEILQNYNALKNRFV